MNEPRFLALSEIETLHGHTISHFGGGGGLRDQILFEGASNQALHVFHYGKGDLFEVAAAYAFHLSQAKAFLDGNQRTGLAAALVFLKLNGVDIPPRAGQLHDAMTAIAKKGAKLEDLAALLRVLSRRS
ncbi:hypothetical protein BH09VER1_BH09VER1_01480 [soil metagenome]